MFRTLLLYMGSGMKEVVLQISMKNCATLKKGTQLYLIIILCATIKKSIR
jgi:hypothetical protein